LPLGCVSLLHVDDDGMTSFDAIGNWASVLKVSRFCAIQIAPQVFRRLVAMYILTLVGVLLLNFQAFFSVFLGFLPSSNSTTPKESLHRA
jgi:hypothetical protein